DGDLLAERELLEHSGHDRLLAHAARGIPALRRGHRGVPSADARAPLARAARFPRRGELWRIPLASAGARAGDAPVRHAIHTRPARDCRVDAARGFPFVALPGETGDGSGAAPHAAAAGRQRARRDAEYSALTRRSRGRRARMRTRARAASRTTGT